MKKVILVLWLMLPPACLAQIQEFILPFLEPFTPATLDARSAGMGRTAILSATGSNAIFSNPALLGTLDAPQLQFGGRFTFGFMKKGFFSGDGVDYGPRFKLNHASFALPYQISESRIKTYFGLGYSNYYDLSMTVSEGGVDDKRGGGLNLLSPAVSVNVEDRYFFGVAFHKSVSSSLTERIEFEGSESDAFTVQTSASFLSVGALVHISPTFSAGGTYRTGFDWTWKPDSLENISMQLVDFKLSNPALWGLGIQLRTSPDLVLVAEYQNRPFSDHFKVSAIDMPTVRGINTPTVDDGYNLRLGMEHNIDGTDLRFGLFRDAKFLSQDKKKTPVSLYGWTIGLGVDVGAVQLNTALETTYAQVGDLNELANRFYLSVQYVFHRANTAQR